MRTLQVKVSETDYRNYKFESDEIQFKDLVDAISRESARKALRECNEIAEKVGLSSMTLDEINAEITGVRNAKANS